MARWKLTEAHYLNVPGTQWEHKETDRSTGKQARKVFDVPLYLDPEQPADCNYFDDGVGEIIVCYEGKGQPRDIVFEGPPTKAMTPLDAEAEAITAPWREKWLGSDPIESLPANFDADTAPSNQAPRNMPAFKAATRSTLRRA